MFMNDKRIAMDHINKKWVRVLTVITYIISISLIALVLGLYYRLVWHPKYETDEVPHAIEIPHYEGPNLNQTISMGKIKVIQTNNFVEQVICFLLLRWNKLIIYVTFFYNQVCKLSLYYRDLNPYSVLFYRV